MSGQVRGALHPCDSPPKRVCALLETKIHRIEKVLVRFRAPKALEDGADGIGLFENTIVTVEKLVGRQRFRAKDNVACVIEPPIGGQEPSLVLQALEQPRAGIWRKNVKNRSLRIFARRTKSIVRSKTPVVVRVEPKDERGINADAVVVNFLDGFKIVVRAVRFMADGAQRVRREAFKSNKQPNTAAALAEFQYFRVVGDVHRGLAEPLQFKISQPRQEFAGIGRGC